MSGIVAQNILDNTGLIKASSGGAVGLTFISKQTASSSATLSFTSGIDSTYKEYLFTFNNMHPATDNVTFQVNFRDGGSDFDATKTTTFFRAFHAENDSAAALAYQDNHLAQGTGFQTLAECGNDNDQCTSGTLTLFEPSSTTFVKHFISDFNFVNGSDFSMNTRSAGYCNVTDAIDGVQFKMNSGNTDSGDICLYGLTT